uniref:DDE-1 domain-containing protein n=1 Tax=Strongyloides papillosus TaxID=174720 RepID=A0A0N5C440_STREA
MNDLSTFVDPGSDVYLMAIDNVTKFGVKNIMLCKEQLKVDNDQDWNIIGTGKITLTLGKKDYTVKCRLMNNMNIIHPADILLDDDFLKETKGYEADYKKGTFKTIRDEYVQLIRTSGGEKKDLENDVREELLLLMKNLLAWKRNLKMIVRKCTVKAKEMCLVENKSFPKVVRYVNNPQKQAIINEFGK